MTPKNHTPLTGGRALLTICLVLASAAVPVSAMTVTDDAGTSVTFTSTPQRIVSLSPGNTEILAALGLQDSIVGITDVCNFPPWMRNKTRIGGYSAISIEKVAAVKPDLVIASDLTQKETIGKLREIGLTVMVIAPKKVDHVMQDIRLVGLVTGTGSQAEGLATNISRRIAAAPPDPGRRRPTVAHVVYPKPLYVSGNTTLQDDIITRAGGTNVFAGRNGWSTVSLEEFLMANPDIIIVSGGGGMDSSSRDIIREEFMNSPQYTSLTAVRNGHIYAIDADIISRPGPRVADATEEVSVIIANVSREQAGDPLPSTTRVPGFSLLLAGAGLLAGRYFARVLKG